jgi:hypothetical protein
MDFSSGAFMFPGRTLWNPKARSEKKGLADRAALVVYYEPRKTPLIKNISYLDFLASLFASP